MTCVEKGFIIVTKNNTKGKITHLDKHCRTITIKNENGKHIIPINDLKAIL